MSASPSRLLAVGVVIVGIAAGAGASKGGIRTGAPPVTISAVGNWPLTRLGYTSQPIVLTPSHTAKTFAFAFPFSAAQGKPLWYLMHLHFKIALDPRSPPGTVNVVGYVNHVAAALIEFVVTRTPRGPRAELRTTDALLGWRTQALPHFKGDVNYRNFLGYAAVRPGPAKLTFMIRRFGARARSVSVYSDSGLEVSRRGRSVLHAAVRVVPKHPRVGDVVAVDWKLVNTGDRPAHRVSLRIDFDHAFFSATGPARRQLGTVRQEASGRFYLRARRAGQTRVFLTGSSGGNQPGAEVSVAIRKP